MTQQANTYRIDPSAPYANAAARLWKHITRYELEHDTRLRSQRDIATLLGVKSPTTVGEWLAGRARPRRKQAIAAAERLNARNDSGAVDRFIIARDYGYPEISNDSPATISELIEFVERAPWDTAYKATVIARLELARAPRLAYDNEIIGDILRKDWPLAFRAERIAQFVDLMNSASLTDRLAG